MKTLEAIAETTIPKFFVLDIETYIKNNKFRLMSVYDGKQFYHYRHNELKRLVEEMLYVHDDYKNTKKTLVFYAHFGGGFDFYYVLNEIFKYNKVTNFKAILSGSLLIQFNMTISNVRFEFRDSFALFRQGLNKVSEALIGKTKTLNLKIHNLDKFSNEKVFEYCDNDCKILYDSIIKYFKMANSGIHLTSAALSMSMFRRNFLTDTWRRMGNSFLEDIRKWQHAGRVDVFKRYAKDVVFFDVNNFYPSIMKTEGAPIKEPRIVRQNIDLNTCGFYKIYLLEAIEENIPFLPFKLDNKLYFLNEPRQYYYITTYEIKLLNKCKAKYKLIYGYEFRKNEKFFTDYIDYWVSKRIENPAMKFLSKNMLNHLSGKFAQKQETQDIRLKSEVTKEQLEDSVLLSSEYDIVGINKMINSDFMNPQISIWIWAGARAKLWHYLKKYEKGLCYCDTDSLVINPKDIDENDVHESELGKFKIEHRCKEAIFLAPKCYAYIDENNKFQNKIKGFDKAGFSMTSNINWKAFKDALLTNKPFFRIQGKRINKFKSAMKKQKWLSYDYFTKKITKTSIKRVLLEDNINTKPYSLN